VLHLSAHRRTAFALVVAAMLTVALAPWALAKGDVTAKLDAPLPGDGDVTPGAQFVVGWTLSMPEGGAILPVSDSSAFLRLLPKVDGSPVTITGQEQPAGSGHYLATLTMPAGGIASLQVGVRRETCDRACREEDFIVSISPELSGYPAPAAIVAGPPVSPASGGQNLVAAIPFLGVVLVALTGTVLIALAFRRNRRAIGA